MFDERAHRTPTHSRTEEQIYNVPELDKAGDREDTQRDGKCTHQSLRSQKKLTLIEMIGRKACEGKEKSLWPELKRHHRPNRGSVVVSKLCEDEPVLSSALNPCADVGN